MQSPVKQPVFIAENKENLSDEVAVPVKGIPMPDDLPEVPQSDDVPAVKEDEDYEPILQENSQRFVLFPIKYHEVREYDAVWSRNY